MNSTSESLLLRLQRPDDQLAWTRFVQLYTPLIFFWARKTGLQTADATDLVQDVLTITFQKLPTFQYDAAKSFRGWLRTITLNKFREHCRRKSLGIIDITESALTNVAEHTRVAESTWDLNYQQALMNRALDLLEPDFQPATWAAVKQFVISGRPAAEVAAENGISVWTVYAAKSRLLARLREELSGLLD